MTSHSQENIQMTGAELLALALVDLFPNVILIGGRATQNGFLCDFSCAQELNHHSLPMIEEKMRLLTKKDLKLVGREMMRENAAELFRYHRQPLLAKAVLQDVNNVVNIIQIGEHFFDYCPHKAMTAPHEFKAFKLISLNTIGVVDIERKGASIVRVEGIVAESSKELKKRAKQVIEGKKRDHQKLGVEREFFVQLAPGNWVWLPRGVRLMNQLRRYWEEELAKQSFEFVSASGWATRSKNHFLFIDLYLMKARSYRELPLKWAELTEVFEELEPRELEGLLQTQVYNVDREVIFCDESSVLEELISSLQLLKKTIIMFAVVSRWSLVSRKPKKSACKNTVWDRHVDLLIKALKHVGIDYRQDEGNEAKFGPIVEVHLADAQGRFWSGPYMGFNLILPEAKGLQYRSKNGETLRPVMITRSMFGSWERFAALLIEKTA